MFAFGISSINGLVAGVIAAVAGFIVMIFPRILNYIIAVLMILSGIAWIASSQWLPGGASIAFGILLFFFPRIINYLVAAYLILLGIWFVFFFSPFGVAIGLVTLGFGIVVLIFPNILNYIFGGYLIIAGILAIGRYFNWF
jgi:hypothetical protein